jgi:hypothetical protein
MFGPSAHILQWQEGGFGLLFFRKDLGASMFLFVY